MQKRELLPEKGVLAAFLCLRMRPYAPKPPVLAALQLYVVIPSNAASFERKNGLRCSFTSMSIPRLAEASSAPAPRAGYPDRRGVSAKFAYLEDSEKEHLIWEMTAARRA